MHPGRTHGAGFRLPDQRVPEKSSKIVTKMSDGPNALGNLYGVALVLLLLRLAPRLDSCCPSARPTYTRKAIGTEMTRKERNVDKKKERMLTIKAGLMLLVCQCTRKAIRGRIYDTCTTM